MNDVNDDLNIDDYFGNYSEDEDEEIKLMNEYDKVQLANTRDSADIEGSICVGIDLGTTNSCVAIWDNATLRVEVLTDKYGNRTLPSIVSFTNFTKYVGHEAKNQKELNPNNTIYEIKRLIGKNYDDDSVMVESKFLSYALTNSNKSENNILIQTCAGKKTLFTPEEISSYILSKIKTVAEENIGKIINTAVITVPAYFNNLQRKATQDAATIAGINCIKIINEPTAAACAYGLEVLSQNKNINLNVLVFDLGGGTLDVSLLNISDGIIEVLSSSGNSQLGGSNFDAVLINYCLEYFSARNNFAESVVLDSLSSLSKQQLKLVCEEAKIKLSTLDKVTINIDNFYNGVDLNVVVSNVEYEQLCSALLILCMMPVEDAIKKIELTAEDIDEIILVGGGTRMPSIKRNLSTFFRNKPLNDTINPDEVVACGAAIHAYSLCNKSSSVAENMVLLDITPLSLGVETLNSLMNVIIPRGTTIPTTRKKKYTTCDDNQDSVEIKIFEGERSLTKDNYSVGSFMLDGIEKLPRGMAEVEVTFSIDANGIVNVMGTDVRNKNNKKSIVVNSNTSRLTRDEVEAMIIESQKMHNNDKLVEEKRQFYFHVESMCYNVLDNLKDLGDKLSVDVVGQITGEINDILVRLREREFYEHKKGTYLELHNAINKKYGTLILTRKKNEENFSSSLSDKGGLKSTLIFGDDDDEVDGRYEMYEDYNLKFYTKTTHNDNDEEELNKVKNEMVELCNSITEMLLDQNLGLEYDDVVYMREYVDDCMLWAYVNKKLTICDYCERINKINIVCDEIMSKYDADTLFVEPVDVKIGRVRDMLNGVRGKFTDPHACIPGGYDEYLKQLCVIEKEINEVDVKGYNMYDAHIESITKISKLISSSVVLTGSIDDNVDVRRIDMLLK